MMPRISYPKWLYPFALLLLAATGLHPPVPPHDMDGHQKDAQEAAHGGG
jgi:hypothetical protein